MIPLNLRRTSATSSQSSWSEMLACPAICHFSWAVLSTVSALSLSLQLGVNKADPPGMFFFGSLLPTFFLDKWGRRKPSMIGSALCGISMMLIAALLSPQEAGGAMAQRASSASVAFFFTVSLHVFLPWGVPLTLCSSCSVSVSRATASHGCMSLRFCRFTSEPRVPPSPSAPTGSGTSL